MLKLCFILFLNFIIALPCFAMKNGNYSLKKDSCVRKASKYKISSIDPRKETNLKGAFYPGFRGSNQLVIYTPKFGRNTGTNEFGKEAIVVDNRVFAFNGADSYIPPNGFVISGHGNAKKWINQNLIEGAFITINKGTNTIESVVNTDSYIYKTDKRLSEVKKIFQNYKSTIPGYEYKTARKYYITSIKKLNKAKYYKSQGDHRKAMKELNIALMAANSAFNYAIPAVKGELNGVWIRPVETSPHEIAKTLNKLKKTGIDNIFLETYYQGYTIFPSQTMAHYGLVEQRTEFVGWDPLKYWIKEAHERGIKIHVWFQAFYVGNDDFNRIPEHILSVYPEWANVQRKNAKAKKPMPSISEHHGYFLDPANIEVQRFLSGLISEITTKYNVDGLNIDYIRYPKSLSVDKPGYWASTWGYTDYARKNFRNIHGIDPLNLDEKHPLLRKWIEYRQNKVNEFVSKIRPALGKKNITLSAVIFPNFEDTAVTKLQNWPVWAKNRYIDAYTPLIMSSDKSRAEEAVREIKSLAGNSIKIYPGLFEPFTSGTPTDLLNQIIAVRKAGSSGVVIFDKAHLDNNFINALSARVFRNE